MPAKNECVQCEKIECLANTGMSKCKSDSVNCQCECRTNINWWCHKSSSHVLVCKLFHCILNEQSLLRVTSETQTHTHTYMKWNLTGEKQNTDRLCCFDVLNST